MSRNNFLFVDECLSGKQFRADRKLTMSHIIRVSVGQALHAEPRDEMFVRWLYTWGPLKRLEVEFIADLSRFNLTHLDDAIVELMRRRVVDVAATLPSGVDVIIDGERVDVGGFEAFVRKFGDDDDADADEILDCHPNARWHVAIRRRTDRLPKCVSFVNNICTEKGGTHVEYVVDKIVGCLKREIETQLVELTGKSEANVKPMLIKTNLSVFVNCLIENPSFESQTKEFLTTKPKNFGSTFDFEKQKLIDWAKSSGLVGEIVDAVVNLKKKPSKKSSNVRDIVKLEDAALAGTSRNSKSCTLIVTEGDSAKALALAGLEILGRDAFGVFPLKGKLANVANLDEATARGNNEIASLMRILGLRFGVDVDDFENWPLRYGRIMILADQDEDGSHIKGLIINLFRKFWPKLLEIEFIRSFRTPLLKARKGNESFAFFTHADFQKWCSTNDESSRYSIKYYKGLGTSTSAEARQYFSDLDHHTVR
ncbi:unnamed protein product [Caenorhabditis bovis]|uniref:DNA topoisomerase 2 n=1 Tax=Caenorhabditis bovis TaxID=2654633 RepID=A0A8S1EDF5_9PELO|nr:unnamed protein product [Caenorhabditis bovis]